MSESNKYEDLKNYTSTVYVIQEIQGSRAGTPKINIMGASQYGRFKFLLPELSQIIFSPGPLIYKLRDGLRHFNRLYLPFVLSDTIEHATPIKAGSPINNK